ncbi:hypothetical protein [Peribacillus frigoritolerans]|uniref:hypothetical protein n=1 Tax=Peribacillus frigoritolerans TaxID=450367 RepID=UPI0020BFA1A3|nr:hypothetical protein [Peribacillus frigoritolerans]
MEKKEMIKIILNYLERNPFTQTGGIESAVHAVLTERGIMGEITTGNQYMRTTRQERIPNNLALLINEVIYDLMYSERIITPGVNRDNLGLPFVHVSNMEKLIEKKKEYV